MLLPAKRSAMWLALLSAFACNAVTAQSQKLTRDEVHQLIPDASGVYWSIGQNKRLQVRWLPGNKDGAKVRVFKEGARLGDDPVAEGTWSIRTVVPKKGEAAESVDARNDELRYVLCEDFGKLPSDKRCWDIYRASAHMDPKTKELAPKQQYRFHREGEVETRRFEIESGAKRSLAAR
ncbi:MAG: hypothetical protein AAF493_03370 [Pseudomonadota bacterium]